MSRLEDRLRDAYQGAAATVTPANIRGLGEPAAQTATPPVRLGPVWGRWLTPLAAAAAVAAVAILAAILVSPGPLSPKGASAEPKFLIADVIGARPFEIRDAATGALVAHLTSPARSGRSAVDTTSVATADGRHYVMAVYTTRPCRSRLYQFQLDDRGQPSAVTPLARPAVPGSSSPTPRSPARARASRRRPTWPSRTSSRSAPPGGPFPPTARPAAYP
jgi:hypothetical protein